MAPLFLLGCYAVFFLLAMVLPSVQVRRATGLNPVVLASGDDADGFVGRMFKLLLAVLPLYLGALSLGWIEAIGPIGLPAPKAAALVGGGLIAASLLWVLLAQWQMGRSWRIGIDKAHPGALVSSGLFRFSRNPIFLGMLALLAGMFLAMPDAVTVLALGLGFALISVQVRLEEAHLAARHGAAYDQYRAQVRRWL